MSLFYHQCVPPSRDGYCHCFTGLNTGTWDTATKGVFTMTEQEVPAEEPTPEPAAEPETEEETEEPATPEKEDEASA